MELGRSWIALLRRLPRPMGLNSPRQQGCDILLLCFAAHPSLSLRRQCENVRQLALWGCHGLVRGPNRSCSGITQCGRLLCAAGGEAGLKQRLPWPRACPDRGDLLLGACKPVSARRFMRLKPVPCHVVRSAAARCASRRHARRRGALAARCPAPPHLACARALSCACSSSAQTAWCLWWTVSGRCTSTRCSKARATSRRQQGTQQEAPRQPRRVRPPPRRKLQLGSAWRRRRQAPPGPALLRPCRTCCWMCCRRWPTQQGL